MLFGKVEIRKSSLTPVPLILVMLASPMHAGAASPSRARSIEEIAASADVVVRGRIKSCMPIDLDDPNSALWEWHRITVEVAETMKSAPRSEVEFFHVSQRDATTIRKDWMSSTDEAVFFLRDGARLSGDDKVYAHLPLVSEQWSRWEVTKPLSLSEPNAQPLYSLEFCEQLPRDRILGLIRAQCAAAVSYRWELIVVPDRLDRDSITNFTGANWPCLLSVPLNSWMEQRALEWANSLDLMTRWNALLILRHKQSPASVQAVRQIAAGVVNSREAAVTREMAIATLQKWGIRVSADVARSVPVSDTLLLLSVVAIAVVPWFYMRLAFRPRGGAVLVIILALILVLWMRSYIERDALAGGSWEIGCSDGTLIADYRDRFDEVPHRAWRWCRAEDLWAARDYFRDCSHRQDFIPWRFVAGMQSWGNDVFPIWTWLHGIAVPFKSIALAVAVPLALLHVRLILRARYNLGPRSARI